MSVIELAVATVHAACRRLPSADELADYPTAATLEAVAGVVKRYRESVETGAPVEPVTLEQIGALAVFALDGRRLASCVARDSREITGALVFLDATREEQGA